ncbi:hypothetical protein [Oleiharenicola sp. Vm1]|uniref:hypothetical protein n=1 Tax=Oleiharenicola sp. Vm1 TaxID=3398393 RepID=UPI0039F51640
MKVFFYFLVMCAAPALFAVSTPAAVVVRADGTIAKVLTVARDATQERAVEDLVVVVGPKAAASPNKDEMRAAAAAVAGGPSGGTVGAPARIPEEPAPATLAPVQAAAKAPAPVVNLDLQAGSKVAIPGDPPLDPAVIAPTGSSITVAPKSSAGSLASVPNPFDVRFIPSAVLDEYAFRVTAAMWGNQPVVFINGRPFSAGEQVQGFTIYRIRTDGCILERGSLYFFLPRGLPVTIRLPKA